MTRVAMQGLQLKHLFTQPGGFDPNAILLCCNGGLSQWPEFSAPINTAKDTYIVLNHEQKRNFILFFAETEAKIVIGFNYLMKVEM